MKIFNAVIFLILLSGCAQDEGFYFRQEINPIENFTPSGCYYDYDTKLFDCITQEQEDYLNANLFTPKELDKMDDVFFKDDIILLKIFMRMHNCVAKFQDSTMICKYSMTADTLDKLKKNGGVISEKEEDGKFVYLMTLE